MSAVPVALPKPSTVYWCSYCQLYGELQFGKGCPMEHNGEASGIMRKRRGYICPGCDQIDSGFFLTKEAYLEHTHA